ncbi:hypothetical protein IAT40_007571 [Kwoniella sp. CBS 6097]
MSSNPATATITNSQSYYSRPPPSSRLENSLTPYQLQILSFVLFIAIFPVTWCMYLHWRSMQRRYPSQHQPQHQSRDQAGPRPKPQTDTSRKRDMTPVDKAKEE